MKKEYIMSDEDKVLKRQKIEQNRAKKRSSKDNSKIPKMKKESLDESNCDDTTSIVSAVSAASVLSEPCFWESDKNYADLDANQESAVESFSPVAAVSVPSPSSSPQNYDIAGSKTLEMLKESSHDSTLNFTQYEQAGLYNIVNMNIDKDSPDQVDSPCNSRNKVETHEQSIKVTESAVLESASTFCSTESLPSLTNCSSFKQNPSVNSECRHAVEEFKSDAHINEYLSNNGIVKTIPIVPQLCTQKAFVCQKSKGSCMIGSDLATKIMQKPGLVTKLMTNPNVIARVIQDQNIFAKLIADPEILSKLASDPEISQYLEDEIVPSTVEQMIKKNLREEESTVNRPSSNVDENEIDGSESHVENPILTDLITTNGRGAKKNQKSDATATSNSHEVTDDITKDLQRYITFNQWFFPLLKNRRCEAFNNCYGFVNSPFGFGLMK